MNMADPLMMAVQMFNGGHNPLGMLQNMAGSDPRIAQAMRMINGKSPQQLQQIAVNMARERGIDIPSLVRQLGINLPR